VVCAQRAADTYETSGVRVATIASATRRDSESLPPRLAICFAHARTRFGDRKACTTTMGLHLRRREAQGSRPPFCGGHITEHAFERRAAKSPRTRQTRGAGFG